jgi:hypothetical protein
MNKRTKEDYKKAIAFFERVKSESPNITALDKLIHENAVKAVIILKQELKEKHG